MAEQKLARGDADIDLFVGAERFDDVRRARVEPSRDHIVSVEIGREARIKRGARRFGVGSRHRRLRGLCGEHRVTGDGRLDRPIEFFICAKAVDDIAGLTKRTGESGFPPFIAM